MNTENKILKERKRLFEIKKEIKNEIETEKVVIGFHSIYADFRSRL